MTEFHSLQLPGTIPRTPHSVLIKCEMPEPLNSTITNSAATSFILARVDLTSGKPYRMKSEIYSKKNSAWQQCGFFLCSVVRCIVTDIIFRSRGIYSTVLCRWRGGIAGSRGTRHSSLCSVSPHAAGRERPCSWSIKLPVSPYGYLQHSEFHNWIWIITWACNEV